MKAGFVIVGSGVAGGTAAMRLRAEGFEGPITIVGDEPGPPCSRPPLSKQVLRGEVGSQRADLRPQAWFDAQAIDLVSAVAALRVDPLAHTVTLADGRELGYERLLLATGGRVRQLPGASPGAIHYLRTVADAVAIAAHLQARHSVIVLGAGFIGAEVAASARMLGCDVTMLEAAPHPMGRVLPAPIGALFTGLHRDHGVRVVTNAPVERVVTDGGEVTVALSDGTRLCADIVVAGLGMVPNVELAQSAGVAVDNGIVVDEHCRTDVADIYAAGDVANHPNPLLGRRVRIEHWQSAQHHGAAAARNMLGHDDVFAEIPWVWTDQYDLNIQVAGDPSPSDEVVEVSALTSEDGLALLVRDGFVRAVVGFDQGDAVRAVRKALTAGPVRSEDVTASRLVT